MLTAQHRVVGMDTIDKVVALTGEVREIRGASKAPVDEATFSAEMHKRMGTYTEMYAAVSAVQVAGPPNIAALAIKLKNEVTASDHAGSTQTEAQFVALAQQILGTA
jgi:hypothetical protein